MECLTGGCRSAPDGLRLSGDGAAAHAVTEAKAASSTVPRRAEMPILFSVA